MHQQMEPEPLSVAQQCHLVGVLVMYGMEAETARQTAHLPVMWDWYRAGTWRDSDAIEAPSASTAWWVSP